MAVFQDVHFSYPTLSLRSGKLIVWLLHDSGENSAVLRKVVRDKKQANKMSIKVFSYFIKKQQTSSNPPCCFVRSFWSHKVGQGWNIKKEGCGSSLYYFLKIDLAKAMQRLNLEIPDKLFHTTAPALKIPLKEEFSWNIQQNNVTLRGIKELIL